MKLVPESNLKCAKAYKLYTYKLIHLFHKTLL